MVTALHVKAPQSLQEQLTELSDPEGGRYTGPRIQDMYKGNVILHWREEGCIGNLEGRGVQNQCWGKSRGPRGA